MNLKTREGGRPDKHEPLVAVRIGGRGAGDGGVRGMYRRTRSGQGVARISEVLKRPRLLLGESRQESQVGH